MTSSNIAKLYRERHAHCMALARQDRETGNLRAHSNHMEGAASARRQFIAVLAHKRKREAEGYVYLDNGFDAVRLTRDGRTLTPTEVRAELASGGAA